MNLFNEIQILPPNTLTFNFSLIDISSNSTCRMLKHIYAPSYYKFNRTLSVGTFLFRSFFNFIHLIFSKKGLV